MSETSRSIPDTGPLLHRCEGDPASSAWVPWTLEDKSRFNGQFGDLQTRRDGPEAIIRLQPHAGLRNAFGNIHGGAIMAFADMALFLSGRMLGIDSAMLGVTVDLNVQFTGSPDAERPIDARIQITRETGRLIFLRGTIEQSGDTVAGLMGILRKHSGR